MTDHELFKEELIRIMAITFNKHVCYLKILQMESYSELLRKAKFYDEYIKNRTI